MSEFTKCTVGNKVTASRSKKNMIEDDLFPDEGNDPEDENENGRAHQTPTELFKMLQKSHFFFVAYLLLFCH